MPTPRPLTPKRPKLSLQTSTASALPASNKSRTALNNLTSAVDSPSTFRNTYDNAFEATPATSASAKPHTDEAFTQLRHSERPSPHTASSSSSISTVSTSPFANTPPYPQCLGARSILRNSPFPRRQFANLSSRPPKRMFQPIKRVTFHESLIEMIPTPILSDSEISIDDDGVEGAPAGNRTTTASNSKPFDKSDGIPARRKRRGRDWIWRPVNDETLPTQANGHSSASAAFPSGQDSTLGDSTSPVSQPETIEPHDPIP